MYNRIADSSRWPRAMHTFAFKNAYKRSFGLDRYRDRSVLGRTEKRKSESVGGRRGRWDGRTPRTVGLSIT